MDPERARIQADLSGQIDGQVRCDDIFLQMYASDASIYEQKPLGVVRPANADDVVACVKYAQENQLTIYPRGAGSNVVGAVVGSGLILDFSYAMRRIEAVDRETVIVEPGIVLAELNNELRSHGRFFSPDPATRSVSTIGGVLSMNSSGAHWARYGTPRDKVISLDVVTATGEQIKLHAARHSNKVKTDGTVTETSQRLHRRVESILRNNAKTISESEPDVKLNQAGYNVFDLDVETELDLTRLMVGSEGTLGLITRATLQTDLLPRYRGVALLFFHRLETAAKAAVEIAKMGVAACDLLDRRLLSLAREKGVEYSRLIPSEAEAMLLVEFEAPDDSDLRGKLEHLQHRIQRRKKLAFDVRTTTQVEERNRFWRIARRVTPSLYRLKGTQRALPFVEDVAVPPAVLPEFLTEVHKILNKNEVTASIYCHTPQGSVHVRPFLNLNDPADLQKMNRLANQMFEKVNEYKGTISGCHGDGLSRSWFLRRQYGPLHKVFSEIKNVFDPLNTLNPGKIVGHPYHGLTDHVRSVGAVVGAKEDQNSADASDGEPDATSTELPVLTPVLNWNVEEIAIAARNCNGCGRCRTGSEIERMCPIFRLAPREEASPRAKANLMRGILTGDLDLDYLTKDEFKSVADLCVNCHQCRFECPANVDIPKLMMEAKGQYQAVNGLRLSEWLLTRLDLLYSIAGRLPRVTNRMIRSPSARWLLDRLFGIAQGRKLPRFSKSSFIRWAARNRLTKPSKQQSQKIVYFVDAYANWNDVELGKAFVEVLKHNGIDVVVPPGQSVSGMSLVSEGAIARAKKLAVKNVELLAEWVRQGYKIVTTEPSAALVLKHEYSNLMDDSDTRLVAENTIDCSTFLLQLHQNGDLELDFKPLNATIGYHLPCHQRALGEDVPAVKLLNLIPGLQVEMIKQGCSGMAGTYGLKRSNYHRSLRLGMPLIGAMRQPTITAGTTECSACKIQMEQGTTKPTIHPIKLLALAYGVMPELEDLFSRRSEELVVT